MLIVWTVTLGAGLANACMPEEVGSRAAPFGHRAGAALIAMVPVSMAVDGNNLHALQAESSDHARSHQVHCQPFQARTHARVSSHPTDKSFDLDAIAATITQWAKTGRPIDRRHSARLRSAPVFAQLPLFIRFRRLVP